MARSLGKVTVHSDTGVIRFFIDLYNSIKPLEERIDNTDRDFLEALVMAYRELGTINSLACDDFIRKYLDKPTLSRRSFRNYRSILTDKKWLVQQGRQYEIGIDELRLHGKKIPQGIFNMLVTLERVQDAVGTGS